MSKRRVLPWGHLSLQSWLISSFRNQSALIFSPHSTFLAEICRPTSLLLFVSIHSQSFLTTLTLRRKILSDLPMKLKKISHFPSLILLCLILQKVSWRPVCIVNLLTQTSYWTSRAIIQGQQNCQLYLP